MFRPPSIIASEENQFRSIVSLIRAKYNSAVSIYSSKLNTFFTISQTAPVFVIKNKAMELYMSEQMMVIFDEARSLSETVLDAYRCIFTNNPVPSFNDKWLRLCSLRSILEIPQLTCFCYEHKGSCATEVPADAVRCWGVPSKCCFDENKQPKYQAKNIRAFS